VILKDLLQYFGKETFKQFVIAKYTLVVPRSKLKDPRLYRNGVFLEKVTSTRFQLTLIQQNDWSIPYIYPSYVFTSGSTDDLIEKLPHIVDGNPIHIPQPSMVADADRRPFDQWEILMYGHPIYNDPTSWVNFAIRFEYEQLKQRTLTLREFLQFELEHKNKMIWNRRYVVHLDSPQPAMHSLKPVL
jgi:hypothetical protein